MVFISPKGKLRKQQRFDKHEQTCIILNKINSDSNLEPIPKSDRNIAVANLYENVSSFIRQKSKNKPTITNISDKLWNILSSTLPTEKPNKMIGRPVTPFRKVLYGILYVLRTGCQWKMLPKEFGSGSTCHRRSQQWIQLDIFKKIWIRLLK